MTNTAGEVISPCNEICLIDEDTGFCIGCLRTGEEIASWTTYTNEQKNDILNEVKNRSID